MNRDAKDRPIAEAQSGINPAHQDGEAVVSKRAGDSAESGIEFRDQASVTLNLKDRNDCRFLFGKYGDEVFQNSHNQTAKTSFVIAEVDAKINTIYIRPC